MKEQITDTKNDEKKSSIQFQIYRFKFSVILTDQLLYFSKLHQFDDRDTFKLSWTNWIKNDEIASLLTTEIEKLTILGLKGDILDKIYKSARYYYRTKQITNISEDQPVKQIRKKYVGFSKNILKVMDEHIQLQIQYYLEQNNIATHLNVIIQPAYAFNEFCINKTDVIKNELIYLEEKEVCLTNDIYLKFKKTYKNRFFIAKNKCIKSTI